MLRTVRKGFSAGGGELSEFNIYLWSRASGFFDQAEQNKFQHLKLSTGATKSICVVLILSSFFSSLFTTFLPACKPSVLSHW